MGESFPKTKSAFREEADIQGGTEKTKGLLEKKWTSVVRLQKKGDHLEDKLLGGVRRRDR